nr:PREDICTED: A disintegrin and metalloproteinase with thrombospondin motifs 12-like [Linepithema humile]
MMHEYVSYIQTFFHLPSLGIPIDISLVHLNILQNQPATLNVTDRSLSLLLSFCKYTKALNPPYDNLTDTGHWDISLYITGTDLFEYELIAHGIAVKTNYEVWGQTYFDGACSHHNSCAIVQFLPFEVESSGLRSSLNAVHLIGRLLGLEYDSEHETGYFLESDDVSIMSRVRPYRGNITWSPKSREKIKIQLKEKSCFHDNTRRN